MLPILDNYTALRLFTQCALHKLPHLLGSEVMYYLQEIAYERWYEWQGPLSVGTDQMVEGFLSKLTCRDSISPTPSSLHILQLHKDD